MTSTPGWFLMHRSWMDTPALNRGREPYDRCSAWAYLIEHATYQDTQTSHNGHTVIVLRGQFSTSFRTLADTWSWSTTRVRAFLDRMATDALIKTEINTGRLLITLCDYDRFQRFAEPENTPENTSQNTQQTRDQHATNTLNNEVTNLTPLKEEGGLTPSADAAPSDGLIPDNRQLDLAEATAQPSLPTLGGATVHRMRDEPQEAFDAWNAMAQEARLPQVTSLTDKRRSALRQRMKEAGGLDGWKFALSRIPSSRFLTGKVPGRDGRKSFRVDLDYMLQPTPFAKLMEGGWNDRDSANETQELTGTAMWAQLAQDCKEAMA